MSSFGADQFDDNDEKEKKKKSSFFNYFYLSINIGAMIASSVLVWIQMNVGWGWGFGVPAVAMALAVAFFFFGTALYRLQLPGGSPLTRICQVLVASVRKFNVKVPDDKSLLYETGDGESNILGSRKLEHTEKFKFLDKAVWASGILFSTVYSQMSTMFVLQGNTMDQHLGPNFKIPSASLSLFDTVSVIFWAPACNSPHFKKVHRKRTGIHTASENGDRARDLDLFNDCCRCFGGCKAQLR